MRSLIVNKKDKRGLWGIVFFFIILFAILILGFIGSIVLGVIDFGSENITPIFEGLGVVGDTNFTQASQNTFGVADTMINYFKPMREYRKELAQNTSEVYRILTEGAEKARAIAEATIVDVRQKIGVA